MHSVFTYFHFDPDETRGWRVGVQMDVHVALVGAAGCDGMHAALECMRTCASKGNRDLRCSHGGQRADQCSLPRVQHAQMLYMCGHRRRARGLRVRVRAQILARMHTIADLSTAECMLAFLIRCRLACIWTEDVDSDCSCAHCERRVGCCAIGKGFA